MNFSIFDKNDKMKYWIAVISFLCVSLISIGQSNLSIDAVIQSGHSQYITCSDFSPNGKFVVTGSGDNSIILWDAIYGKQIRNFNHHFKRINSLSYSHNGKTILSTSNDNSAKLINVETGDLIHSFQLKNTVIANAYFSSDDQKIIITDDRDGFSVWSSMDGELLGKYKKNHSRTNEANLLSPDGTKVLSKVNWKTVACMKLSTNDTLFTMDFDKAYTMSFSQNGKFIVIGSSKLFSKIFDANSGELIYELKSDYETGCDGCNTVAQISNTEKYGFTMSSKNDGILWSLKTGKKIKKFGDLKRLPYSVAFSADDKYLLISFSKAVYVYNIQTGKNIVTIENKWMNYYEYKFNSAANQIIVPTKNNTSEIWDVSKGRKVTTLKGYLNEKRADGLKYDYTNYYDKKILHYISLKTNLSLSPNNNYFTIGKVDTSAVIINLQTGRKVKTITDSKTIITHDYSQDGKWMAIAGGDGKISIYDTKTNTLKYILKGHTALVFDLRFSANGTELVSGSWDGTMIVWDFKNESIIQHVDLGGYSPYLVRYSPNDLYVLTGDLGKGVDFWEIDSKQKFRSLIGHTNTISGMEFSKDGSTMVTSSWDGKIKIWNVLTGMLTSKIKGDGSPVYAVCYSTSGKEIISAGGDRLIHIWNSENAKSAGVLKGHTAAVTDIKMTTDGKYLVSRAANGEVMVWDYFAKKEIYTYIQINQNDWLVKNSDGYFDGSPNALSLVNYVSGMEVISLNSLFDKYYTPNLVVRLMKGEKLNDSGKNLKELIDDRPQIKFQFASTIKRDLQIEEDSIYQSKSKKITLNISVLENGKSINEIRLYNNGKLLESESWQKDIVFRGDGNVKSFEIDLIDGVNEISAIAISGQKVESDPINLTLAYNDDATNSDLHVFSIGINKYKNKSYDLNYAVKDANDFSKVILKGADSLFDNVYEYSLQNSEANKVNIIKTFKDLVLNIDAEDVFVFYYAGHGVMSLGEMADFYLVAHNVTNLYGEELLKDEGMSATELMNYSQAISAQKQLFVLDACHSGGALNSFSTRGGGREKAIAQLARNTGTFFLTASQDVQYANESGDLKHGLFTYALLEVLNGDSFSAALDGKITINEIKTYVEERVPELSEQYHGSSQYPTSYSFGQDFPIVILK